METSKVNNTNEPIFEIKKWNAVALWAWGKYLYKLLFYKIFILILALFVKIKFKILVFNANHYKILAKNLNVI